MSHVSDAAMEKNTTCHIGSDAVKKVSASTAAIQPHA